MLSDHHPSTSTPIRRLSASVFGTSSSPLSPVLSQSYKIRRTPSLTQSQGCISWSASSPVVNSDSSIKKKDLSPRTLGGKHEPSRLESTNLQRTLLNCDGYKTSSSSTSGVLPGWIHKLSMNLRQQQAANRKKLEECQEQILQLQLQTRHQVVTIEKIEASKDNLRRRHRQLALKNKTRLTQQKQREEEIKLIVKECQQLMERQQKLLNDHHLKLKEFENEGSVALDSGLFFFALYLSKSHMIKQSITLLVTRLVRSPPHRKWVNLVLQWIYVVEIVVILKWMAKKSRFYTGFNEASCSVWSKTCQAWKRFTAWRTQPD